MKAFLVLAVLAVSLSLVEPVPHHDKPLDKRFIKGLWKNWFGSSEEEEPEETTSAPEEPVPDCAEAEAKLKEWIAAHGDHTDKRFIHNLWNKWFHSGEEEEPATEAPASAETGPDCAAIEAKLKELMDQHPEHEETTVVPVATAPPTPPPSTEIPDEVTDDFTTPPATTYPQTPDESDFTTPAPTTEIPDEVTDDFTTPPGTVIPEEPTDAPAPAPEAWMTWVPEDPADCVDQLDDCVNVALRGKCNRNKNTRMKCANSCICNPPCEDLFFNCADLAGSGKCETKPVVQQRCKKTCELC